MPTTELVITDRGVEQIPFKGIGLPTNFYPYPKIKLEEDLIFDSVITILLTKKGQRLFAPTFGSDLWKVLFQPADNATATMAEQYIWEALRLWEPRIQVLDVRAGIKESTITVYIKYMILTVGEDVGMRLQIDTNTFVLIRAGRS
jgi:phage baseplate assembly protein W